MRIPASAANLFLALVQGWTTLSPFNAGNFVDAYLAPSVSDSLLRLQGYFPDEI
jgi:hypothetical protein